jgi:hypothetical protein
MLEPVTIDSCRDNISPATSTYHANHTMTGSRDDKQVIPEWRPAEQTSTKCVRCHRLLRYILPPLIAALLAAIITAAVLGTGAAKDTKREAERCAKWTRF